MASLQNNHAIRFQLLKVKKTFSKLNN